MKNLFTAQELRDKYDPDSILLDIEKYYSDNLDKLISVLNHSNCPISKYNSDSQISFLDSKKNNDEIIHETASLLKDTIYFMILSKKDRTNVTQTMRGYYTELIKNQLMRVDIMLEDPEIASPKHAPDPNVKHKGMSQVYTILKMVQKTLSQEYEYRKKLTRSGYLTGLQISMGNFFMYLKKIGMTQKDQITLVQNLFDGFNVDWEEGDRDNIKHSLQKPALDYHKMYQEDVQKISSSLHSNLINDATLTNLVDQAILLKRRIRRF